MAEPETFPKSLYTATLMTGIATDGSWTLAIDKYRALAKMRCWYTIDGGTVKVHRSRIFDTPEAAVTNELGRYVASFHSAWFRPYTVWIAAKDRLTQATLTALRLFHAALTKANDEYRKKYGDDNDDAGRVRHGPVPKWMRQAKAIRGHT